MCVRKYPLAPALQALELVHGSVVLALDGGLITQDAPTGYRARNSPVRKAFPLCAPGLSGLGLVILDGQVGVYWWRDCFPLAPALDTLELVHGFV